LQKTLRKPENWQDFESLCKKLWGEIWQIPNKIKKNGRLGQEQAGVDVYGIPKNEAKYWGIQAKGKDDYTNAKLTEKEILQEIEKAKKFQPELEVYIIASSTNKDAKIEEFVRLQDVKNQAEGSFEILLYCWEDIVDLIEENRETLNWYLGINSFRENYDFSVSFENGSNQINVNPKFLKKITKYKVEEPLSEISKSIRDLSWRKELFGPMPSIYGSNEINESWCSLKIALSNIGNVTIENWHLKLKIDEVKKIDDNFYIDFLMSDELRNRLYQNRTLWAFDDTNEFHYEPVNSEPLIQKADRTFEISFIPHFNQSSMKISWELLARDFDKSGILEVELKPEYEEEIKYVEVSSPEHIIGDTVKIEELIKKKQ
jgi:hypothetical protein